MIDVNNNLANMNPVLRAFTELFAEFHIEVISSGLWINNVHVYLRSPNNLVVVVAVDAVPYDTSGIVVHEFYLSDPDLIDKMRNTIVRYLPRYHADTIDNKLSNVVPPDSYNVSMCDGKPIIKVYKKRHQYRIRTIVAEVVGKYPSVVMDCWDGHLHEEH